MRVSRGICFVCLSLILSIVACDAERPLAPGIELLAATAGGLTVNPPSSTNALAVSWSQIDVSWQDNSSNESGFEVHRSTTGPSGAFNLLATTAASATSYSNGGLSGSSQYCYEVRAFKTTGNKRSYSAFSSAACATTPAAPVPAAVSGVHAAPAYGRWIGLTWTDNSSDENGFRIERSATASGPWASIATPGPNVTAYNDFQFFGGNEQGVCYRVFAVNSYGDAAPSNVSCTAIPAFPTNLAATIPGDGGVNLTWSDNSAVEDGYVVLRTSGGADWSVHATLPANTTSYHDAGLTPNVTYWYEVRATKDGGLSDYSNAVQVVLATTPPAAPLDLGVVPQSSSSLYGSWNDVSTNEAGFRVERSSDGGASWVTALTLRVDESYFTDQGLSAEQQVCYRAIAFNNLGDSPPSNTACTTPPAAPTDLTVTGVDAVTVDIAWTDNSAVEDGYQIWVDDGYGNQYAVASVGPNVTTLRYVDSYAYLYAYYFIAALKDGGNSDYAFAYPPLPPGSSSAGAGSTSRVRVTRPAMQKRGKP